MSVELFAGGGGRLVAMGPVTPRMGLFAVALLVTVFVHLRSEEACKWRSLSMLLVAGFLGAHLPSVLIGLTNGASPHTVFTDLSPILFWLIAPFFALVLKNESMVSRTATLIQWSAVGMALVYLLICLALAAGVSSFDAFHGWADTTGEISFRNHQMFFYKGFLYVGIGTVFWAARGGRWQGVWLTATVVALTLTLTRGFVIATSLASVLLLVTMGRQRALWVALGVIALVVYAVWVYLPSLDAGYMLAQRGISNSVRANDLSFMKEHFDMSAVVFGQGMGTYINGRLSIENSYLTIFWKMGLVALIFWLAPLGIALHYFRKIRKTAAAYSLACAFFFGLVLVYVQTGSNPYLNNPIGLSFVLMAVFSLRTLAMSSAASSGPPRNSPVVIA